MHGIFGHWEVVEALSNYKKSYFGWYGNSACGDLPGSNWIKKDQDCVPPRPVWRKRGEGPVWFSVYGAPLDDWANGGYDDVLFMCGKCSFISFRSLSTHSKFPALSYFHNAAKKMVLVGHNWDKISFYLHFEIKET